MDISNMDKVQLKEAIVNFADKHGMTLPKSWGNKSEDNLRIMLDELLEGEFENDGSETPEPVEKENEPTVSIADIKRINKSFLKQLQAEEYVDIEIDPTPMYPEGSTVPIGLNGVVFRVPVGIYFAKGVPKSIAEVYRYSKSETRKAMGQLSRKLSGEIKIQ